MGEINLEGYEEKAAEAAAYSFYIGGRPNG